MSANYCWLPHKWERWADLCDGKERFYDPVFKQEFSRPALIQERRCKKCGMAERRVARA